ncbi:GIY-YIG nuclease family protein [Cupriavidus oxalaticus]|uniref:GIY-YIG nuclease family protein n=1 Tax=Cupriavidus oxalaticus TaxID=96344 RepID=UPI0012462C97|nr:GIY-YIG nuclease family protein [Cupriavidus oxalaticus]
MALFDQDDRSADDDLADAQSGAPELIELDEDAEASQSTIRILDASRDFAWELSDPVLGRIKGTDDGNGFGTFELNLDRSLAEQLGRFFDSLETAELTLENIQRIPDGCEGAYALYRGENLIYVGKSNARRGLKTRLARHRKKLSNRIGISPNEVRFKAAQIFSFSAFNVEALLLLLARERLYKSELEVFKVENAQYRVALAEHEGKKPAKIDGSTLLQAWKETAIRLRKGRPKAPDLKKIKPPELNNSGFGSNDTGVERDTQETSKFDLAYPLDLQSMVDVFSMAAERQDGKYCAFH